MVIRYGFARWHTSGLGMSRNSSGRVGGTLCKGMPGCGSTAEFIPAEVTHNSIQSRNRTAKRAAVAITMQSVGNTPSLPPRFPKRGLHIRAIMTVHRLCAAHRPPAEPFDALPLEDRRKRVSLTALFPGLFSLRFFDVASCSFPSASHHSLKRREVSIGKDAPRRAPLSRWCVRPHKGKVQLRRRSSRSFAPEHVLLSLDGNMGRPCSLAFNSVTSLTLKSFHHHA